VSHRCTAAVEQLAPLFARHRGAPPDDLQLRVIGTSLLSAVTVALDLWQKDDGKGDLLALLDQVIDALAEGLGELQASPRRRKPTRKRAPRVASAARLCWSDAIGVAAVRGACEDGERDRRCGDHCPSGDVALRGIFSDVARRRAASGGVVAGDRVADAIRCRPIAVRTDAKGAEPDELLGPIDRLERTGTCRAEIAGVIRSGAVAPDARPAGQALEVRHRASTSAGVPQPCVGGRRRPLQLL
jgi:hypothetical protein